MIAILMQPHEAGQRRPSQSAAVPPAQEAALAEALPEMPEEFGLLSSEEMVAILRETLGAEVPEERLRAAVAALKAAAGQRWEMLPTDISPDMGYNFFVSCSETCYLARAILDGEVFRIFHLLRTPEGHFPWPPAPAGRRAG